MAFLGLVASLYARPRSAARGKGPGVCAIIMHVIRPQGAAGLPVNKNLCKQFQYRPCQPMRTYGRGPRSSDLNET